jgi:hypothetical protein
MMAAATPSFPSGVEAMNFQRLQPCAWMSVLIALLLGITAAAGLMDPSIYAPFVTEPVLAVGLPIQDGVSLVAAPLLLLAIYFARRGSVRAWVVWTGLVLYATYFYAFYVFGFVYTVYYPLYLAIVGLGIYTLIGLLLGVDAVVFPRLLDAATPVRLLSVILGVPILLVPVWLGRIQQRIATQEVFDADLVFVLDLTILIPALVLTAVQLWRRRPMGYLLSGVLLVKAFVTGLLLTLGSLVQLRAGFVVAPEEMGMYVFLLVAGLGGALLYLRHLQDEPAAPRSSATLIPHLK